MCEVKMMVMHRFIAVSLTIIWLAAITPIASATVYNANPENYRNFLPILQPGDTLALSLGTYNRGLGVHNLNGTEVAPITIMGPSSGVRAVFVAQSGSNTVSISNSSYVRILNLQLDGRNLPVDAVKAEGTSQWAHHITLENLYIQRYDNNQQIVGISTKCPAWNWIIRNNIIDTAGTGMYLGNSDGSAEFVAGLIEGNLIADTIGYNLQIKHQYVRNTAIGEPESGSTIIRNNVFIKARNASFGGDARPNVLVGHWPLTGVGSTDHYLVYGNFFFQNPTGQGLFQGEGNIALYSNLFYNSLGNGLMIQPHNELPRDITVFGNTVVTLATGIQVVGGAPGYSQLVIGNASFAQNPIQAQNQSSNVTGTLATARNYLNAPFAQLGQGLDLYPQVGPLRGPALNTAPFEPFVDYDRDFNYVPREFLFRGGYEGEGVNPGWVLQRSRKPTP